MAVVIKAFPCSFDGINSEWLEVGVERDFGHMTRGLQDAGFLALSEEVEPPLIGADDTPPKPAPSAPLRRARGRK
jgi:hypothetical protein